jgi:hypothetical protein
MKSNIPGFDAEKSINKSDLSYLNILRDNFQQEITFALSTFCDKCYYIWCPNCDEYGRNCGLCAACTRRCFPPDF